MVATRNIRALSADRGVGDDIPQVEEALRRKVRARQKRRTYREVDGEVGAVQQDDPALSKVLVGHEARRFGADAGLRRRRLGRGVAPLPAAEEPKHFAESGFRPAAIRCLSNPRQPNSTRRRKHPAMLH